MCGSAYFYVSEGAPSWELWEMTLDCRLVWNSKTFWRFLMLIYDSFFAVTLVARQHVPGLRIKWTFETPKLTKIEDPSNTEYWIISQTDTQKQNSEKYSDAWFSEETGKEKKWSNQFLQLVMNLWQYGVCFPRNMMLVSLTGSRRFKPVALVTCVTILSNDKM